MKPKDYDLHVCAALFTVSIGKRAICFDLPIDDAIRCVRQELLESVGEEE